MKLAATLPSVFFTLLLLDGFSLVLCIFQLFYVKVGICLIRPIPLYPCNLCWSNILGVGISLLGSAGVMFYKSTTSITGQLGNVSQPITMTLYDRMWKAWLLVIVLKLVSDYRCLLHECSCLSEKVEIPTKCVKSIESFDIVANVMFIDFEGRSDGESIRKILAQIKPRQLVSSRAAVVSADWCRPDICSHIL